MDGPVIVNSIDNLLPELIGEIFYQSDPGALIKLYQSNRFFRKKLSDPLVVKTLGKKFGWFLESFEDLVDAYYTSYFTPDCYQYFNNGRSLRWALKTSNLEVADQFFNYYRFRDEQNFVPEYLDQFEIYPVLSDDPIKGMEWYKQKVIPYGVGVDDVIHPQILGAIARHGQLPEVKKMVTDQFRNYDFQEKLVVLNEVIESGNLVAIDFILRTIDMKNLDHRDYASMARSSERSGNQKIINYVNNLLPKGLEIPLENLLMGIFQGRNLNRIIDTINQMSSSDIAHYFHFIFVEDYHSNDLEIFKVILGVLPNPPNLSLLEEIFSELIGLGKLNLLQYATHFFRLTPSDLDIIYFLVVTALDITAWLPDKDLMITNNLGNLPAKIDGEMRKISDLMYQTDLIGKYKYRLPYRLPKHPGVFRWFSNHGSDKSLYTVDLTKMITTKLEYDEISEAIISYRIDPAKAMKKLLASPETFVGADDKILSILSQDYRVGCMMLDPSIKNHKLLHDLDWHYKTIHESVDESIDESIDELRGMTYSEKLTWLVERVHDNKTFQKYNSFSSEELSAELNILGVPFIPCVHHQEIAMFLAGFIDDSMFKAVIPIGIYNWLDAARYYMIENGTYQLIGC